ncbi:MAG: hypothetical protein IJN85_03715 [Oscillospiraceae bacterium]|nr:hypothetical protein [Oscillospiraceae bacterium]
MVSFFKEWALGVCFAALAGAIIFAVAPNGTMKKSVKMVVAIVVICAVILPFAKSGLDIDWSFQNQNTGGAVYSEDLEDVVEYQLTAAYADEVTQKADYILSTAGLKESEITLMTDINEQGSIFIKKAYIKLPDNLNSVDVETQKELYELFGKDSIIVFN